ncbi:MAG: DmsC/YnfH family molybdoenzyme membrane anchor subunit [Opitutaceae bacterium]
MSLPPSSDLEAPALPSPDPTVRTAGYGETPPGKRSGSTPPSVRSFLAELLDEQQQLQTPVARFASFASAGPAPAVKALYRDLIPLSRPGPGEHYAFEVDLDSCSGCKACVAGCHSLNGLDDHETWRDVGLLLGSETGHPFQQTVTSACHHCADPACLSGCPVLAYEKDPVTGIVRHLDDQCIGCQYCVLKCPYDVPKYSERLGIVRKCDLCHSRLSVGEAPACVQACPTEAIRIVTVSVTTSHGRLTADTSQFLSPAPDPRVTFPTTRYVSARPLPPGLHAADHGSQPPQPAHLPLVFMLVLTQVGVGLFAASCFLPADAPDLRLQQTVIGGLVALVAGLAASIAHLGQPLRAWRVFLNLRRSWLSREAVIFGAAVPPALAYAGTLFLANGFGSRPLGGVTLVAGALGVLCSAMIYIDTHRASWSWLQTGWRFLGTLGVATLIPLSAPAAAVTLALKLIGEAGLRPVNPAALIGARPRGRALHPALRGQWLLRTAWGAAAVTLLALNQPVSGFFLFLFGELAERRLFFQDAAPSKMPGVPRG